MTRYVRRRPQPRKPWEWKGVRAKGAPRTLLSNWHWYVFRQVTDQTRMPVGDYDPLLRLYRRFEPSSVLPEWDTIPDRCQWVELVDDEEEIVLRIDMKSARMRGSRNRRGQWALDLDHYTEYTKEHSEEPLG